MNTKKEIFTEISGARHGAKAIVSMTYDDGHYQSSVWMKEMYKRYGLCGSTMLIAERQNLLSDEWKKLYSEGYLSPENHSMTHVPMPGTEWPKYDDYKHNNTDENYQKELIDSKKILEAAFGKQIITFAPSNNTLSDAATEIIKTNYYAMRKGSRGNRNVVQSFSPIEGSHERGGWYNPYMYGLDETPIDDMKANVQACIDQRGWFISMTHGITGVEGKAARFEEFYRFLSEKQAENEIWVTSFENATKYLRERQNSISSAYLKDNKILVSIIMADKTGDGLPLTESVFNHTLTVKTEVFSDWSAVEYELNGERIAAKTFKENGKNYAYIDVCPNSGEAAVFCVG